MRLLCQAADRSLAGDADGAREALLRRRALRVSVGKGAVLLVSQEQSFLAVHSCCAKSRQLEKY
jgi:hypothetical protein